MDNVIWVVLASAVFIALAGIILFVGSDSIQQTIGDANETQKGATCGFLQSEVDEGRIDPDSSQWKDRIDECGIES